MDAVERVHGQRDNGGVTVADLRMNTDTMRDLGTDMAFTASEFEHANTRSDTIAAAVGHEGLANAITEFAHGWDDRRKEMIDSISFVADAARGIADGFDDTDIQLAQALTDDGGPSTAAPRGAV